MATKQPGKPKREPKPKSAAKPGPAPGPEPEAGGAPPAAPEPAEPLERFLDAHREKLAEPEPEPPRGPSALAAIRRELERHGIMDLLPDCEFRLEPGSAKHGDAYRLFVDDYPSNVAVLCRGGRFSVGGRAHPGPAEAARAACDALLAQVRAGRR